jgi:hypothetical protein
MTPEERARVNERLDAWLADFAKLESPIEGALDDLHGWIEEAKAPTCDKGKQNCPDCLQNAVHGVAEAFEHLRILWTERVA